MTSFILIVALDNLPVGIFRKTIWYRKRKMKFWEYLNFISLYYDSQLCGTINRRIYVTYLFIIKLKSIINKCYN